VTATNRDLEDGVARGSFRADLYYRIAVVQVLLPPLRERPGDVALLAREFLRRFNRENGTSLSLEPTALAVLAACPFPGNVRELENCVRRTATFASGVSIAERTSPAGTMCACLPSYGRRRAGRRRRPRLHAPADRLGAAAPRDDGIAPRSGSGAGGLPARGMRAALSRRRLGARPAGRSDGDGPAGSRPRPPDCLT